MMHWRIKRRLSAYIDDELTTDESSHVQRHLADCVGCRHRFRELQASEALLRRMPLSLVPQEWTLSAQLRLKSTAGIPPRFASDAADGLALRAAAATLSMALILFIVTIGPLSSTRPEPRGWVGMLPTAERESTILSTSYEPAGGWGRH